MDPILVGTLSFAVLFVLLALTVPIGFAMGLAGLGGMGMIIGWSPALSLFGTTVYETTVTYDLSIVPLFVLMGSVASRSGLSRELYEAFNAWFGAFRGGLALATIGACGAFAAICATLAGQFLYTDHGGLHRSDVVASVGPGVEFLG